jgi:hypothetical protein
MSLQDATEKLEALEGKVTQLEETITAQKGKITGLEAENDALKKTNESLSQEIGKLSAVQNKIRIDDLVKKHLDGKYTFKNGYEKAGFDQMVYGTKEDGTSYTDKEIGTMITNFLKENVKEGENTNTANSQTVTKKTTVSNDNNAANAAADAERTKLFVELKTLLQKTRLSKEETARLIELQKELSN